MQNAHEECSGTGGGVKDFNIGNGGDKRFFLRRRHINIGFGIIQQIANLLSPLCGVFVGVGGGSCRQSFRQRFARHIIHNFARRIIGAGLFARIFAGFRIIGG